MNGYILKAACLVVIMFGAREMGSMLSIVLIAVLLAYTVSPVAIRLIRMRVPAGAAVFAVVFLALALGAGALVFAGTSLMQLTGRLPAYEESWRSLSSSVMSVLARFGIETKNVFSLEFIGPERLVGWAKTLLMQGGQTAGQVVLLVLLFVFALIEIVEIHVMRERGEIAPDSFIARFNVHSEDIMTYVSITGLTGLVGAFAFYIALLALGVQSAATWAALSFLLNFIPNFGAILTVVPPALLALLEWGWVRAVAVIAALTVINLVVENVLKPRIMKDRLRISPFLVLVSLVFWTWVLGPLGAILAVPLTITIRRVWEKRTASAA